jgi:hypothetical protein
MSAREIGGMSGRARVLIVENSLSLLGNGYRDCAVVFGGDPDETAARWECQAGESQAPS